MTEPTPRPGRPARSGSAARPVTIRATETERADWQAAADLAGLGLSEWIRGAAQSAASRTGIPLARAQVERAKEERDAREELEHIRKLLEHTEKLLGKAPGTKRTKAKR